MGQASSHQFPNNAAGCAGPEMPDRFMKYDHLRWGTLMRAGDSTV